MNRRNVLIGLGGLVAGGGALLGTGAFTTVEAERTMTVETAGDADAFLGLQIRDDLAGGGDEISLDFANAGNGDADGFNLNARTVLDRVLFVQNNGTQDGIDISFEYEIVTDSGTVENSEIFQFDLNEEPGTFDDGSQDGISVGGLSSLDAGDATTYDLEVELRESEIEDEDQAVQDLVDDLMAGSDFDVTVTIIAEQPE